MKNNKALVSYVKSKLGALYWYGTFGQKASPALYRTKSCNIRVNIYGFIRRL